MKKMNLKHLNLSGANTLSRERLKTIFGGWVWDCPERFKNYCSLTFLWRNSWDIAMYIERECINGRCDTTAPDNHVLADQSPCFSGIIRCR